jgi:four helix bundle protein
LSIASNIAEGIEKDSNKETLRYLDIAGGSIAELITQIYIGIEIGYIEKTSSLSWIKELSELSKMAKALKNNFKG